MQPTQNLVTDPVISPADTLRGAGLYLIRHGWHQGDMFDQADPEVAFPPACGLGAIRMALVGTAEIGADTWSPQTVEAFAAAVMAWAEHLFTCYGEPDPAAVPLGRATAWHDEAATAEMSWPEQIVVDWNDAYDRNAGQVIAALNGAADEWFRKHRTCWCECGEDDDPPSCDQEGHTHPHSCQHCATDHSHLCRSWRGWAVPDECWPGLEAGAAARCRGRDRR
ncbi:DUF6197 family protein [Phytohabitans houttuyneae]|uniref:Uncharacterized protein n=1 Tax=Phytohabitans houttuyneae TaxID=1076126 RepID=A0A6V8JYT5_9ACTN|nr:hypothetical protein Phou_006400 [Phytohabitans houttuyneae]